MVSSTGVGIQQLVGPTARIVTQATIYKEPLTRPVRQLVLARVSKPWSIIQRIIGLVVITYLLSNTLLLIAAGLLWGGADGVAISFAGMFCSAPLLMLFIWMRRPKLVHVQLAEPDINGRRMHILPDNKTLMTPMPTRFSHHLMRDAGLLDIPPSRTLWFLFGLVLSTSTLIFVALLLQPENPVLIVATVLFAIPAWLAGFSIPVFAWWSYSTRTLNIPTIRHHAESALVAGMVSTIPALMINSVLSPWLLVKAGFSLDSTISEFFILAASAPVGEELCKLAAVLWCCKSIDSPRRGFEIGFTVGLGFAMLENLQYILFSWAGGPLAFTLTSLIRGIGSIPGHAFWTGLTGAGVGWMLHRRGDKSPSQQGVVSHGPAASTDANQAKWQLIDPITGEQIGDKSGIDADSGTPVESVGLLYDWKSERTDTQKSILPRTVFAGLMIAIAGHSFWNATSMLVPLGATTLGASDMASLLVSLGWTASLIAGLLMLGSWILREVRLLPDTME